MSSGASATDANNKQAVGAATNVGHGSHPHHHQQPPRPPPAPGSHPSQTPQQQQPPPPPGSQHQPPPSQQPMADSNKRAALAGQWRTPPLPVFPTSVSSNQPAPPPGHQYAPPPPPPPGQQQPPPAAQQPSAGMPAPTTLPGNSEDYAKALQEAYRRGAEAAAAMAAQQQHISPSASCPNFQMPMAPAPPPPQPQQPPHGQTIMTSRSEDMTSSSTPSYSHPHAPPPPPPPPPQAHGYHYPPPPPHPTHSHHPPQAHHPQHPQPPAHTSHPQHPPPPPHQYAPPTQYVPPVPAAQTTAPAPSAPPPTTAPPAAAPPPAVQAVPNPLQTMPPPPNKPPPPAPPSAAAAATTLVVNPPQQRSVSLPDMTSYAVHAEEEKRQKRLARNRASARLRRLRKKNLVDAYETEVGILEKTLQQLKAHEWGVPTSGPPAAAAATSNEKSHQSLLEALCMDRGQQVISSEQRAQQCQDILEQQLQQMELLRQVQFEQQLLAAASCGENKEDDPELAEMAAELNQVLALSDDQKAKLQEGSKGLDEEMTALDTVFSSLVMMKENEWLLNQGVQDITDQLTSILHKNQMSKFLLWADANVEAIDQLDHVHAAPKTAPHPQGPIFTFGVETTPMEDEGDGK